MLETVPSSQLGDRTRQELFQFSGSISSPGLSNSLSEPFYSSMTIDTKATDPEFDPSSGQSASIDGIESGIEAGNSSDRLPPRPPQTLWAGDCEFDLSLETVNARD